MAKKDIPFQFRRLNAVSLDSWSQDSSYTDVATANATIPSGVRYVGMEVTIILSSGATKYAYVSGILDSDLVPYGNTIDESDLVHKSLDETITGIKLITGLVTVRTVYQNANSTFKYENQANNTNGFEISNLSSSGNGQTILNNNNGNGLRIYNGGDGLGNYIDNTGTGVGLYVDNTSSGYGFVIKHSGTLAGGFIQNNGNGAGLYLQNGGYGKGITLYNSAPNVGFELVNDNTNYGQHIHNSLNGDGLYVTNLTSGRGISVMNPSTGSGLLISNIGIGKGIHMESDNNSGDAIFQENLTNVTLSKLTGTGEWHAQKYIVIGGGSGFLKADGTVDNSSFPGGDLSLKEDKAQKGVANGYAPLDTTAKLPAVNSQSSNVTYNATNGNLSFTWADGSTQNIDLPIENLVQNGNYNSTTKELTLTLNGGSTIVIPLTDLVDLPEVVISASSNPSIAPTTGQKIFVRQDNGAYWTNLGGVWTGGYVGAEITHGNRTILDAITESFTTSLKTAYDTVVSGYNALIATGQRLITSAEINIIANTSGINSGDNATNTQYSGLATAKEDVSNKTNVILGNETSSTLYPSIKALIDYYTVARVQALAFTPLVDGDTWYVNAFTNSGTQGIPFLTANALLSGTINAPSEARVLFLNGHCLRSSATLNSGYRYYGGNFISGQNSYQNYYQDLFFMMPSVNVSTRLIRFGFKDGSVHPASVGNGYWIEIDNLTLSAKSTFNNSTTTASTTFTLSQMQMYRMAISVNSTRTSITYTLFTFGGTTPVWTETITTNLTAGASHSVTVESYNRASGIAELIYVYQFRYGTNAGRQKLG